MKRLPKSVTILGRKYKLKIVTDKQITAVAGVLCEACVDFNTKTIYVWKDLPQDEQMVAIFHEIQHISHMVCGLSQVISAEMQEILCESSAQGFYDLLRSLNGIK
jgi:hypothetical protein